MPTAERAITAATRLLKERGFTSEGTALCGSLWWSERWETAVVLDHGICDRTDLNYSAYAGEQNELVLRYQRLFRFLVDKGDDVQSMNADLGLLLEGEWDTQRARRFGTLRSEYDIDPTPPEYEFESEFEQAFGASALYSLEREAPFTDIADVYRPVDYLIHTHSGQIAVEVNGEAFHHPAAVGAKAYRAQLRKQNSLMAHGIRVYRWPARSFGLTDGLQAELRKYLGPGEELIREPTYYARRDVTILEDDSGHFELRDHQVHALNRIENARAQGAACYLLVLPTGTGKTEVAAADFAKFKRANPEATGLMIAPTRQLRTQVVDRLRERLPHLSHGVDRVPRGANAGFMVQTTQYMTRHYARYDREDFDYIVIDEAHHVMAEGLNRFIRHFEPRQLLGLTATPDRLDRRRVEEVFGPYETALTLSDAIQQGVTPPIRAFRLQTNHDLSELRFRGHDYAVASLQASVVVPSRDRLIAECLSHYFGSTGVNRQGLVFCVNIRHAESMAATLNANGIKARAVSGRDPAGAAEAVASYRRGEVQFLCACSLLSEGFDAPETSIVVMARPTMSKALYVQQIGRGTRWSANKEALYVIDVVDRYGPLNAPWSIHAIFGVANYLPWGDVSAEPNAALGAEEAVLVDLLEYERRMEEINIFTFEARYGDHLTDEEMARELFVSTDTLRAWVRKKEIVPAHRIEIGARSVNYYARTQIEEIRTTKSLAVHDETTMVADFFEFLEERDYVFSFKPVMLLAMISLADRQGVVALDALSRSFGDFYRHRRERGLPIEKTNCGLAQEGRLDDDSAVRRSLLDNPFEKFERKRFVFHAKDLALVQFALPVWDRLRTDLESAARVRKQMIDDLREYYGKLASEVDPAEIEARFPFAPG